MRYAVVGSGLSAWAVYKSLQRTISDNDSISIIDPNIRFNSMPSEKDFLYGQKTLFGSSHMYEVRDSWMVGSDVTNYTMANGGFSTVWGSGIRLWAEESVARLPVDKNEFYEAATYLLQNMPYAGSATTLNFPPNWELDEHPQPAGADHFDFLFQRPNASKIHIFPTPLATSVDGDRGCRGCGECLTGCPYGSIFDTGIAFDFEVAKSNVRRVEGTVYRLVPNDSHTTVEYKEKSGSLLTEEFDHVYLCAGPIGTPAILMRSGLAPNSLSVLDSQAFYFVGLQWPRKKNSDKRFALSQVTIATESDSDNEFSASLYESNNSTRKRMKSLIAKRIWGLTIPLPNFLDQFIFLGIGTLDSSQSGKMTLNLEADGQVRVNAVMNAKTSLAVKEAVKRISKKLLRNGLLVIPWFSITPSPGGGFHSGGALPIDSQSIDRGGSLRSCPSIHIADASLLPFLKPGAHTFTSMSLSSSLILGR